MSMPVSMPDDVDRPVVGLPKAMERLRSATYTGRDPENLVAALVDGEGMVERITLAATVAARRPQTVAAATLAAIAEAQRKALEAVMQLASTWDTMATAQSGTVTTTKPRVTGGIVGGPDDGSGADDDSREEYDL